MIIRKHQGWQEMLAAAVILFMLLIFPVSAMAEETVKAAVNIPVYQQIDGDTPQTAEVFTFVLKAAGNAPMPEGSVNGRKTARISGNGTVSFGQILYTNIGEYRYTISEVRGINRQYTYSSAVYSASVLVTWKDAVGGDLEATLNLAREDGIYKQEKALFVNRYKAPVSVSANSQTQAIRTQPAESVNSLNGSANPPKTGDTAGAALWGVLMAVSSAAVIFVIIRQKKTSHVKNENSQ